MIAIGYRAPQDVSGEANASAALSATQKTEETETQTAVNDVVASTIAASVATATNLSVAPSVTSLAISTQIESQIQTTNDASISKPEILQVSSSNRAITQHTVQAGDTVDSLAAKYGVSKDTIKWANNLTTDGLTVGTNLEILPRDGILYTVQAGDTAQSIAEKYQADPSVITTYNDLDISGVSAGQKIVVVGGVLPTTERPGYVAPAVYTPRATTSSSSYTSSYRSGSVGNRYAWGNCTWWAYERRAQMGRPVGSFWGNGGSWAYSGAAAGFAVNNVPAVGAVYVEMGSPGHVGVVESVLPNGDIVISEMNNSAYGGYNIVNNRTINAGQASLYRYVH